MSLVTFWNNLKQKFLNHCLNNRKKNKIQKIINVRKQNGYAELDNYKLTVILFFALIGTGVLFYAVYLDYKYNIGDTIKIEQKEPITITIESPNDMEIPGDYEYENYTLKNGDNLINILTQKIGLTKQDAFNYVILNSRLTFKVTGVWLTTRRLLYNTVDKRLNKKIYTKEKIDEVYNKLSNSVKL